MELFKTAQRLVAFLALILMACSAAFAADVQTSATPPAWYKWSWEIPILRGEYMPVNGGTLGSLGVGFTEDANHTFGVANFFYDTQGRPQTWATGGVITLNDDATIESSGVIATTGISFYSLTNGPCRGCPDHPRDQVQTPDVGKFEWTGPRAGRFTFNGQTQEMVEAFSGLPLIAPTDMAGRWMLIERYDVQEYTGQQHGHSENVVIVDLVPAPANRMYSSIVDLFPGVPTPVGNAHLPPAGSRQYDIVCASTDRNCTLRQTLGLAGAYDFPTIWFDDKNVGRLIPVRHPSSNAYVVADTGYEVPRVYGTQGTIVGRRGAIRPGEQVWRMNEYLFVRIGSGALPTGDWRKPPCSLDNSGDCNPGG